MSRRRLRRKNARAQRHAKPSSVAALADPFAPATGWIQPKPPDSARVAIREASHVERLAYTRTQAAQALGIGRSTFTSSVLPYVDTVETPSGTKLIPADELERLIVEWRRPARPRRKPKRTGRPPAVAPNVADRIRRARAAGLSLRQIADRLNEDGTPTTHGGARWWASTVRSVLGG
jgi:Recombinase